jgi:hypothetical protein
MFIQSCPGICPEQVSFNADHHHTLTKYFCNIHFDISGIHHNVLSADYVTD